jgi:hypothetical protein
VTVRMEVSQEIDRPVPVVFEFYADDHDLEVDFSDVALPLYGVLGSSPSGACYELAQEWLANAENGGPTVNSANRAIRILMLFFNQVIHGPCRATRSHENELPPSLFSYWSITCSWVGRSV